MERPLDIQCILVYTGMYCNNKDIVLKIISRSRPNIDMTSSTLVTIYVVILIVIRRWTSRGCHWKLSELSEFVIELKSKSKKQINMSALLSSTSNDVVRRRPKLLDSESLQPYLCVFCKSLLYEPYQSICGDRACYSCLKDLAKKIKDK